MVFHSPSAAVTRRLAAALGAVLGRDPTLEASSAVVALCGELGAGKTEFVRGLVEGAQGNASWVASPTFVIANEYPLYGTRARRLAHVDLYRVGSEAELEDAGFLDFLVPGTIVAVEWADRFPAALPGDVLRVRLNRDGSRGRRIEAQGLGAHSEAWAVAWREAWEGRLAANGSGA